VKDDNHDGEAPDEHRLIAERRAKLAAWRERGHAYPNEFRRNALAGQLLSAYRERDSAWLEANPVRVWVGGRMMVKRTMGKASFAKIADRSGQIQLFLQEATLGPAYEEFKSYDVGDFLGAEGVLFRTRTDELSVRVESLRLLAKSLRPLPDKWHGVADTELRYRQRYVDLFMNTPLNEGGLDEINVRTVFVKRAQVLANRLDVAGAVPADVADQAAVAIAAEHCRRGLRDVGVRGQDGLHLGQLDPVAAHLHL